MTKEVWIEIVGLHRDPLSEQPETFHEIRTVLPAEYYYKNGKHYIFYEEVTEGSLCPTKCRLQIAGEMSLEIRKTGEQTTHMVFEKDRHHKTVYQTPYGQLQLGIHTRQMEIAIGEEKMQAFIGYGLETGGETAVDCQIKISITPK